MTYLKVKTTLNSNLMQVQPPCPGSQRGWRGSVTASFGRPLEPPDSNADPFGNAWNHRVKSALGEKSENLCAEVENGGASKTDPMTLDAGHGKEMGTARRCEGVPSLTFSNDETKYLADKIVHAIIGKFSHTTIPTSQQIQKSLSHIQFIDGFK